MRDKIDIRYFFGAKPEGRSGQKYFLHAVLFGLTFITCVFAGTLWAHKDPTDVSNWGLGITYAVLIMGFLSAHEFGHYIASRIHKVDATLPYYIPNPIPIFINFGTFGAVIKTRTQIPSSKALFDIGAAGPIAGFVVCVGYLIYGLSTLPPIDFIYEIHPEYLELYGGEIPKISLFFGDTLLYTALAEIFANPDGFLPPMNEIYHYPFLNVGWFGLFVTTLNMLPLGQLDGGHVTYAMFGAKKHKIIAKTAWWAMIAVGFGAVLEFLLLFSLPAEPEGGKYAASFSMMLYESLSWLKDKIPWYFNAWGGWIFWALITKFFIKLWHPPVANEVKLDSTRMALGWFALIILLLSFSYNGIYFIE